MSAETIALPTRLSRRVEKLAREAARTPDELLKSVVRAALGMRLECAVRSRRDLEAIEKYQLEVAGNGAAGLQPLAQ